MSAVLVVAASGPAEVRFAHDAERQYVLLRRGGVPAKKIVRITRGRTSDLAAGLRNALDAVPAGDDLYLYIAGHGGIGGVRAGPHSLITPSGLRSMLATGRFMHALVAVEACDSGVFGRAAMPRIVVLTAAGPHENSFASRYDRPTQQWLGDEFSDALAGVVSARPSLTVAQSFRRIENSVWSAHPQLYGDATRLRLSEFFGR